MNARTIGYWTCTVLVALAIASGGVGELMRAPEVVKGMSLLGYPLYFLTILGVWKVLGGVAILAPKLPLLKEWAYAGIVFDLTGASASHVAVHDDARHIVTPLVIAAIAVASWALRPEGRRLKPAA